jgi:hypothetical protein
MTMLRPSKHSHPDRTVIGLMVVLLRHLKSERVAEYEALRAMSKKAVSGGERLFLPALNVLYLLGLVEYRPKTDCIEYLGPNEAV